MSNPHINNIVALKQPSNAMSGLTQNNPCTMNETSKENPCKNNTNGALKEPLVTTNEHFLKLSKDTNFSLEVRPASNLKLAIGTLVDPHFNPRGYGRVDVDGKGIDVTVWNVESRVIGDFRMQLSNRKRVHKKPFISKMVNLSRVFENLGNVGDEQTITIYHVHGSNELLFKFGSNQAAEFSVELVELDEEYKKLPAMTLACAAALPSEHLREMIPLMVREGTPQRVVVSTTHKNVSITVGNIKGQYKVEKGETKVWMRQESPGEFIGWFQWPHSDCLMKASRLSELFSLCFIDDPRNCFMFRFIDNECFDLAYIKHYDDFIELPSPKRIQISVDRPEKELNYSFKFQIHPASALKNALQSLTDYDFNGPAGLGMIEVNEFGVDIRIRNSKTGVLGLLHLLSAGLINFKCKKPLTRKMVNLDNVALNILLAHDNDVIAVCQVDRSHEISFISGIHHCTTFPAQLHEIIDTGFEQIPYEYDFTYSCELMLPTELLRDVINSVMAQNRRPETGLTASVEIKSNGYFSLSVGQWKWVHDNVKDLFGADSSQLPSKHHCLCFEWHHLVSLQLASSLADWFFFCILTDPPGHIVLRFKLQDFGYLHYVYQERNSKKAMPHSRF